MVADCGPTWNQYRDGQKGGPQVLWIWGEKSCVLLPAAGRRTQLFSLRWTELGVHLLGQPCILFRSILWISENKFSWLTFIYRLVCFEESPSFCRTPIRSRSKWRCYCTCWGQREHWVNSIFYQLSLNYCSISSQHQLLLNTFSISSQWSLFL